MDISERGIILNLLPDVIGLPDVTGLPAEHPDRLQDALGQLQFCRIVAATAGNYGWQFQGLEAQYQGCLRETLAELGLLGMTFGRLEKNAVFTFPGESTRYVKSGPYSFFREGGGLEYSLTPAAANARPVLEAGPLTEWMRGWFGFDEGPDYPGWHLGGQWNGWAMPSFERKVIDVLREQSLHDPAGIVLSWDGDVLVVTDRSLSGDGEPDVQRVEPTRLPDGTLVWDLAHGLCWNLSTAPDCSDLRAAG